MNISGSLRQKLLVPTTLVMSISIVCLATVLVMVQQRQLTELSNSVLSSIDRMVADSDKSFKNMEKEVNSALQQMSGTAGKTLAESTRTSLEVEQQNIEASMENTLRSHAEATADLLAQVAPGAILSNNFLDLIAYVKSATQNESIVFAVFLQPDGDPMTRYLDKDNPVIQRYLETGEGRKKMQKVINASKMDESVMLVEAPIVLEGKPLGKVLLGVDRTNVDDKVKQFAGRFATLIDKNSQQIHAVLDAESGRITAKMGGMLESVNRKNEQGGEAIGVSLRKANEDVRTRTQLVSVGVGGTAILLVSVILYVVLTRVSNSIRKMVNELSQGADTVASSSGQISMTSQSLAEGSSQQAAAIEETSSSLEQMSSMTTRNADNARQADSLMKATNRVVGDANDSMTRLTRSMDDISKASEETSKIVKTIDEIAFQTNLLALNAAVEAARAGQAGAGFAVVADEVRNLAIRSAEAARGTATLIQDTISKVNEGGDLVGSTNAAFTDVASSTTKVAELLAEIAAASKEQSEGIEQVNKAVTEMDTVTQRNAADAEETAASSEDMAIQSEKMKAMVNDLLALVGGVGRRDMAAERDDTRQAGERRNDRPLLEPPRV